MARKMPINEINAAALREIMQEVAPEALAAADAYDANRVNACLDDAATSLRKIGTIRAPER